MRLVFLVIHSRIDEVVVGLSVAKQLSRCLFDLFEIWAAHYNPKRRRAAPQPEPCRTGNASSCTNQTSGDGTHLSNQLALGGFPVIPMCQTHHNETTIRSVTPANNAVDRFDTAVFLEGQQIALNNPRLRVGVVCSGSLRRGHGNEGDTPILSGSQLSWQRVVKHNATQRKHDGQGYDNNGCIEGTLQERVIASTHHRFGQMRTGVWVRFFSLSG